MKRALILLPIVLFLGLTVASSEPPRSSRPRASLLDGWRSLLVAAETAVEEGRSEDADGFYRAVIEQAEPTGDESLLVARAVDGLADLRRRDRRFAEARELYLRSAAMWNRLLGRDQPRLATTLHNLGTVEMALGTFGDAEEHLTAALRIWESSFGPESSEAANTRQALRVLRRTIGEASGTAGAEP